MNENAGDQSKQNRDASHLVIWKRSRVKEYFNILRIINYEIIKT
jgi:hypothetical protein